MSEETTTEEAGSAQRGNGYDPEALKNFVSRIENLQGECDDISAQARDEKAPLREDIAKIKKEAHDAGIPRQALNEVLRERRLRREVEAVRESLDGTTQEKFDQIKLALGMLSELPLGQAALKANGEGAHA